MRPLILGDGAYPLCDWLVEPFSQDHRLDEAEQKFNKSLSSARVVVEQAFGLLKARWRCLLKRLDNKVENVSKIIITCCVLHNMCQRNEDAFADEALIQNVIDRERRQQQRRNNQAYATGEELREVLKTFLMNRA